MAPEFTRPTRRQLFAASASAGAALLMSGGAFAHIAGGGPAQAAGDPPIRPFE